MAPVYARRGYFRKNPPPIGPSTPPGTPQRRRKRRETSTGKRIQFLTAIVYRGDSTIPRICEELGERLIQERKLLGSPIVKHKHSKRSGRPCKMPDEKLDQLLNPATNKLRSRPIKAQITHFAILAQTQCSQTSTSITP